jgi:hypothetical protein
LYGHKPISIGHIYIDHIYIIDHIYLNVLDRSSFLDKRVADSLLVVTVIVMMCLQHERKDLRDTRGPSFLMFKSKPKHNGKVPEKPLTVSMTTDFPFKRDG